VKLSSSTSPFLATHVSKSVKIGDGEFSSRHVQPTGTHHGGVSQIEAEEMAKEEYERVLEDLRHQEGVTANDIRNFEKSAIIQKSLNVVKERAYMQATIRSSNGGAYSQVKSKVARCLKVQKKVAKAQKKAKNQRLVELNDSQQNLNA